MRQKIAERLKSASLTPTNVIHAVVFTLAFCVVVVVDLNVYVHVMPSCCNLDLVVTIINIDMLVLFISV